MSLNIKYKKYNLIFILSFFFFLFFINYSVLYSNQISNKNEIFLVQYFNQSIKNLKINFKSFMIDDNYLYFKATDNKSKQEQLYRIQLIDGNFETIYEKNFISNAKPVNVLSKFDLTLDEKLKIIANKLLIDGKLLFLSTIKTNLNFVYYIAIASDWHVYIFDMNLVNNLKEKDKKIVSLLKVPLYDNPITMFINNEFLFVVSNDYLTCFKLTDNLSFREERLLVKSFSKYNNDYIAYNLLTTSEIINEYDCLFNYAISQNIIFKKIIPFKYIVNKNENFSYLLMSLGNGNTNIYLTNVNFEFKQITNYEGAILDFKLVDLKSNLFYINYSYDPINFDKTYHWLFLMPNTIKTIENLETIFPSFKFINDKNVIISEQLNDGNFYKLKYDTNDIFILSKINIAGCDIDDNYKKFNVDLNIVKNLKNCVIAISNSNRPFIAIYNAKDMKFYIYDVNLNREYDLFDYKLENAKITKMTFNFDDFFVLFKVSYLNEQLNDWFNDLFLYRISNKHLIKLASYKTIGDFYCFKHDNKYKIILTYDNEKNYCRNIGILTID